MLYDVNQPDCDVQFEAVKGLQRIMLDFACNSATAKPLAEAAVVVAFGAQGTWMWERLYKRDGKPTALGKLTEAVVAHAKTHPKLHQQVLDSFDHDTIYHEHIDDEAFRFHYETHIPKKARERIRPLMEAFYENLLASGFPQCVHGLADVFNRSALVRAFWKANPNLHVCPTCGGQRPDAVGTKVFADTDHVLPKSIYPFLAVHARNLLPICVPCNRSFKLDADAGDDGLRVDPMDEAANAPLLHTFLPYLRSAINVIDVRVSRNQHNGNHHCNIVEQNGTCTRRVNNLNRVLKLEARWNSRLDRAVESVREELSLAGRHRRRTFNTASPDELRLALQDMLDDRRDRVTRQPDFIIQGGYLSYVLDNADEFVELFDNYSGDHVQRARVTAVLASE